jgi:hypothetical protein
MGVHGILESMNWIDEELRDYRDDYPRWPWVDEDSRWHGVTPSPVDPRPLWQQDGWPSAEAMEASGEANKEKLLLERSALHNEFSLEEDMWTAIEEGDTATLKYLLDQATDPHMLSSMGRTGALATACELGQLECAKLLREYGAYLTRDYDQEEPWSVPSRELLDLVAQYPPRPAYLPELPAESAAEAAEREAEREMRLVPVREWLASRPPRGNMAPVWSDVERGPLDPGPWQSWEERFPAPPGVKWFNVRDVLSWHEAVRAADPGRRRWARVRKLVKKRGIAMYWQERTQANLCAQGGEGRKRDRESFEGDRMEWSES